MELISKKEIEEAAKDFANIKLDIVIDSEERYFNSNVRDYDAFKSGVIFAESKLKDLTVEFAEWIDEEMYVKEDIDKFCKPSDIFGTEFLTIKQLFEIFIKERNEKVKT